ncbi:unnamed protein product, partial [Prorocentrum cordatum]
GAPPGAEPAQPAPLAARPAPGPLAPGVPAAVGPGGASAAALAASCGVAAAAALGSLVQARRRPWPRRLGALARRAARAGASEAVPLARRSLVLGTAGAAGAAATAVPLPAAAAEATPTVAREAGGGIYIFDQAYGIPGLYLGANIPIRMTVMPLEGGGYLVYNPCNPTPECLQQLAAFGVKDIRYIVLGTIAIEHKFYGPRWASLFPQAEVWISPRTFSYPVDFGGYIPFVGFPPGKQLNKIPKDSSQAPWYSQGVDHIQLTVDYAPRTVFEETVMYHKASGTFVCTDMIMGLSDEPPEILTRSPYKEGLLWFARNDATQRVDPASPEVLRDGYQKSTLLLNNINPRSLLSVAAGDLTVVDQLGLALKSPQPELGYFGWYPCNWQDTDSPCAKLEQRLPPSRGAKGFDCRPGWRGEWARLRDGVVGGIQVPSFVAELQISRDPEAVRGFADEIARRWPDMKQAIPSHFNAPLPVTAATVRAAVAAGGSGPPESPESKLIYRPESGRGQWKPGAA